jgi:phage I-like protein
MFPAASPVDPLVVELEALPVWGATSTVALQPRQRLAEACERLTDALGMLDAQVESLAEVATLQAQIRRHADMLNADRARLAEDLDHARARERHLAELTDEATTVVNTAIEDVTAALSLIRS